MQIEFLISIICDCLLMIVLFTTINCVNDLKKRIKENNIEIHDINKKRHQCPYIKGVK